MQPIWHEHRRGAVVDLCFFAAAAGEKGKKRAGKRRVFAIAEHSDASLGDGENETYTCERIMRKVVEKMKLLVVAGPPSSGKTSVILQLIADLGVPRGTAGVVKFDCLTSFDHLRYREVGVPVVTGFSGATCPDHYFVSNIEDAVAWGKKKGLEWLITESVGLCNRCSPYINGVPAICVIDAIAGVNTPRKIGPMLKMADYVIITKGDIVSQAEREVFAFHVRQVNTAARVLFVNGITGQGATALKRYALQAPACDTLREKKLRFTTPSAVCSYCTGERRIGESYQMGMLKKMEFNEA